MSTKLMGMQILQFGACFTVALYCVLAVLPGGFVLIDGSGLVWPASLREIKHNVRIVI